jgi:hypothetical protein
VARQGGGRALSTTGREISANNEKEAPISTVETSRGTESHLAKISSALGRLGSNASTSLDFEANASGDSTRGCSNGNRVQILQKLAMLSSGDR